MHDLLSVHARENDSFLLCDSSSCPIFADLHDGNTDFANDRELSGCLKKRGLKSAMFWKNEIYALMHTR